MSLLLAACSNCFACATVGVLLGFALVLVAVSVFMLGYNFGVSDGKEVKHQGCDCRKRSDCYSEGTVGCPR